MKPRITVVGVGGGGGNAVNNMINANLEGCEFLVCNTDAQAIEGNNASHKIQLGLNVTRGLGAGANPEIGRAAAEETIEDIMSYLDGSNMVFVTAGMGGGTGTGAAPVIAQAAREAGILTVGVVTKPFHFEGTHRMKLAENGIAEMQKHVDTLIVIPNQNLFRIANEKTTFADAFRMADEVLQSGVRGVTDLMVMPGLINLDFADIRTVMAEMGKAMMGTGEAEGERRAVEAAEAAISNPLLDDISMKGARGVLINITGGLDMTLFEVDEAANRIREEVDPDANIIFGSTFDQSMQGRMRVSVVATGIDAVIPLSGRGGNAAVTPARRFGVSQAATGGYGGYEKSVQEKMLNPAFMGGSTSSAMPAQQAMAGRYAAPSSMPMPSSAMTQKLSPAETDSIWTEDDNAEPEQEPTVGHASSAMSYATTAATARKVEENETSWSKPARPAVTQNYQRQVAPPSQAQPRAERVGDTFIPPRPIDPRAQQAPAVDTFESEAPALPATDRGVKRSPSLFERFTLQREKASSAPVATKTEQPAKAASEETSGKGDDELDIPAFLRRQAN